MFILPTRFNFESFGKNILLDLIKKHTQAIMHKTIVSRVQYLSRHSFTEHITSHTAPEHRCEKVAHTTGLSLMSE